MSLGIIFEKLYSLRNDAVIPKALSLYIYKNNITAADPDLLKQFEDNSALYSISVLSLSLANKKGTDIDRKIEEGGRHIVQKLSRYMNSLGTIAAATPLLGLLGTVIGMIKVFSDITSAGIGDPQILAEGIYEALITTAAGLSVGIFSLMFHRYFRGRISELAINLEKHVACILNDLHEKGDV